MSNSITAAAHTCGRLIALGVHPGRFSSQTWLTPVSALQRRFLVSKPTPEIPQKLIIARRAAIITKLASVEMKKRKRKKEKRKKKKKKKTERVWKIGRRVEERRRRKKRKKKKKSKTKRRGKEENEEEEEKGKRLKNREKGRGKQEMKKKKEKENRQRRRRTKDRSCTRTSSARR